jgi:hypothetical protein
LPNGFGRDFSENTRLLKGFSCSSLKGLKTPRWPAFGDHPSASVTGRDEKDEELIGFVGLANTQRTNLLQRLRSG